MLRIDKNSLICDLAETYQIHNYEEIAPTKVAIFAIGLRDNSRIKMKMTGQKMDFRSIIQAKILDGIQLLLWTKTKDSEKGINRPVSVIQHLFESKKNVSGFKSGKDFEKARANILN